MSLPAGTYSEGIGCKHKSKPAEPFAKPHEFGYIKRVTPGRGVCPAQAFVDWGEYTTWERLDQLEVTILRDRNDE